MNLVSLTKWDQWTCITTQYINISIPELLCLYNFVLMT